MKRFIDLVLILLSSPLWLPLLVITALLVWLVLGRPVFFRQERAGKGGRSFRMLKFRSMLIRQDHAGRLLPDEARLTRFGRLLRSLSLDELPEIWNVLRGEMSLVGPRPLPMVYVSRYTREQAKRLDCLPGITGWAQVNGRNALDWETRFALDRWYVENQSMQLDLSILLRTILTVLLRKGISGGGSVTMTEFRGSAGPEGIPGPPPDRLQPDSPHPSHKNE